MGVVAILRKLSRLSKVSPDLFDRAERSSLDLAALLLQAVALPNGRWSVHEARQAHEVILRYDDDHLQPDRIALLESIRTHYSDNVAIQQMLALKR